MYVVRLKYGAQTDLLNPLVESASANGGDGFTTLAGGPILPGNGNGGNGGITMLGSANGGNANGMTYGGYGGIALKDRTEWRWYK